MLDQEAQKHYDKHGYIVLPMLNATQVAELQSMYDSISESANVQNGFFTSIWSDNPSYRKSVSDRLSLFFEPILKHWMPERIPVMYNFAVKLPDAHSECILHQDWNFVEEPAYDSMSVWIPLIDTDINNGTLQIVPGSQDLKNYFRAGDFQKVPKEFSPLIAEKYLYTIPVRSGDALIMNARALHASPPNLSGRARIAITISMIPREAPLIHYVVNKQAPDSVYKLQINPDFFTDYSCMENPEPSAKETIITPGERFSFSMKMLDGLVTQP